MLRQAHTTYDVGVVPHLAVRVDTFPLVITTFGEGFEADDLDAFVAGYEGVLAREARYVNLIDTSALVTLPSASVRDALLEFTRRHGEVIAGHCLSTELVVRNVAVRTALAAVNWLTPTTTHLALHASLRPAVSRSLDLVWTHRLETSSALLAYHDEVMSTQSIPPARPSGAFGKRGLTSSIEGLLRRTRKTQEK